VEESLTVTATRTPLTLRNIPSAVSVLGEQELAQSPAFTVDDLLRRIPAFSLFRRSSSLVAHPTSQGVSLRGIGPSGVSRTLVLWDGTPLNDPFGGWVYWSQLDKASLERIEVVPGGSSSLYGSAALGGVIQAFSKAPQKSRFELDVRGGSLGTGRADLLGSFGGERWSGLVSGTVFHTDGYHLVAPGDRGPVDVPANSRGYALRSAAFHQPGGGSQATVRLEHFAEDRGNGTLLRENATGVTRLRGLYRRKDGRGREWQLSAYGLSQTFDSSFTAVPSHRRSEFLTREQRVPSRSAGGSLQWTGLLGQRHLVTSGADWQWVRGHSRETGYRSGRPAQFQVLGGSQQLGGVYLQDLMTLAPRWQLQLGARLDGWFNHDAVRDQMPLPSGTPTSLEFPRRGGGMLSPRGGISFHATETLTFRGAAYRSFRAPTLNELYRGFRVGNVVTLANQNLRPETLRGAEAGLDWYAGTKVTGRLTAYWNGLSQAISNITLETTPALITRQRQNVGRVRARGLDAELALRLNRDWRVRGGYLLADSTFGRFPENPGVESNRLPQVPRHRLTASLNYDRPAILSAFLLARLVGLQFDDDRNLRPLANTTLLDLQVSRRMHRNLVLTFAVENLLDRQVPVSRTSVLGIGAPRMISSGLRLAW
jgi:outer membrane receptor protein involved in Fe transport